jgi:flagellar hook-associated protein 3 FlgL
MTRVSNLAQHQQLVSAMLQHQQAVQRASLQVATGKRGDSYDDLGLDAVRQVNLSHIMARESAYAENARRAGAQFDTQDLYIGQVRDSALSLRDAVLGALAAGEARGLGTAAEAAFASLRGILNKDYAGSLLFGGGLVAGEAFLPDDLASLVALPTTGDAFANGPVVSEVNVAEGRSIPTGFGADSVGGPLAEALRALGGLLPLEGPLSDAQAAALQAVLPLLDQAAADANNLQAENGVRARQAGDALQAATDRAANFEIALADIENVNPAEAITRLQAEQNALSASYQVFARLNELSLLNFI